MPQHAHLAVSYEHLTARTHQIFSLVTSIRHSLFEMAAVTLHRLHTFDVRWMYTTQKLHLYNGMLISWINK